MKRRVTIGLVVAIAGAGVGGIAWWLTAPAPGPRAIASASGMRTATTTANATANANANASPSVRPEPFDSGASRLRSGQAESKGDPTATPSPAPATAAPARRHSSRPSAKAPRVAASAPTLPRPSATASTAAPAARPARRARPVSTGPLPGAISGHLRDARGRPLVRVSVVAVGSDVDDAAETSTDDDGFYLLPVLRPGRYVVFAGLQSALGSRIGGRGVAVASAAVSQVELREPVRGATVRIRVLDAQGRPSRAQALLLPGAPGAPSSIASVLGGDAVFVPELGRDRLVLEKVPTGVYTVVLLRGGRLRPIAARDPLRVTGDGTLTVDVRLAPDEPAATPVPGRLASARFGR
jgi:hypothetical protein